MLLKAVSQEDNDESAGYLSPRCPIYTAQLCIQQT